MKKILKNKQGFTLIELIVVIAIIAILAAIAIPTFSGVITDAKKANAISVARNVNTLAQVEILNDEINNTTKWAASTEYTSESTDQGHVFKDAGATGKDDSVKLDAERKIEKIIINEDGITVTYESTGENAGKYMVTP